MIRDSMSKTSALAWRTRKRPPQLQALVTRGVGENQMLIMLMEIRFEDATRFCLFFGQRNAEVRPWQSMQ